jgi:hypothetical protein
MKDWIEPDMESKIGRTESYKMCTSSLECNPIEQLNELIDSMHQRCLDVIAAQGAIQSGS